MAVGQRQQRAEIQARRREGRRLLHRDLQLLRGAIDLSLREEIDAAQEGGQRLIAAFERVERRGAELAAARRVDRDLGRRAGPVLRRGREHRRQHVGREQRLPIDDREVGEDRLRELRRQRRRRVRARHRAPPPLPSAAEPGTAARSVLAACRLATTVARAR